MKNQRSLMKIGSIFAYLCTAVYVLCAAGCFSFRSKACWLWLVLALVSLYSGILLHDGWKAGKKSAAGLVLSIAAPPAFVFALIDYCKKEKTAEPTVQERKKHYVRMLAVSLAVMMLAGIGAMCFQTSGGSVTVTTQTLTKAMTEEYNTTPLNGRRYVIDDPVHSYSFDIYKPKAASAANPAPVVFVMPGFTRTKQTQGQYCIELSRRGFVVFCLDPGCQGDTTTSGYKLNEDGKRVQVKATVESNGLNYLVQYVYNNTDEFDYIDRDRIGLTGHSAGGGNVVTTAKNFAGNSFEESVVKALYVSGYIKLSSINSYQYLNCNAALDYARFDEGRYRYQTNLESFETAATRFINEVYGDERNYDDFILEYAYGDQENGTYRIVYSDNVFHAFQPYDNASVAHTTDFFCDMLGAETDLAGTNQIWWGKEICTGIAMLAGFVMVVALSGLLLTTKFFASVVGAPVKPLKKQETSDKLIFWTATAISAVIACVDYIPLAGLSIRMFPEAHATKATWYFPARMINAVMLWAVVNGAIGLAIFFITHYLKNALKKSSARRQGREPALDSEPFKAITVSAGGFGKTLLLSVVLFAAFYLAVQVMYWLFHVDFRFMFLSASPLNVRFLVTTLMYVPFFFIFYFSNAVRVNCGMTFENWSEGKRMLVGALANSVGLMFIIVVNYICFFRTGVVRYTYSSAGSEVWLFVNMVYSLTPLMFALPILNRIFCRQTNRVWLGSMTVCMIFVMMCISASVSYIPL